jgi:hypothetical protein
MEYRKIESLSWLISSLFCVLRAPVFGQNQSPATAPAVEAAPSISATAAHAAAKKTEAQQTLGYTNAVINYCNRINLFLLTAQNLDREIQRALRGEIAAKSS